MNVILPYSGKFLRGRNFYDETPARENLFPRKFFLQNVLADESSTVPSSCRSSKLSESWPILSSKHRANCGNFLWPTINSLNCEYILGVSSLPLAWQFFTDSDQHALIIKCGYLTIVSTLKMHAVGHHFHAGNYRGCSQTLWPCRK